MLKAKIDATYYPVVCVKSKDKITVPRLALNMLEFDPEPGESDFLLYFREMEGGEDGSELSPLKKAIRQVRGDPPPRSYPHPY